MMEDVKLILDEQGEGKFFILDKNEEIAQLMISISGNEITAHHTEVFPKGEGKGLGKQLLSSMATHARKNGLKVRALCLFVHKQFKRHPEEYADIWQTE